jgi:hypothetical protein
MLSVASLLLVSIAGGQLEASARSDSDLFREYGRVMVGRWEGDVHFDDEVASGHAVIKWAMNRNALECESQIGDMKFKWIGGWDPVSKTIRNLGLDSAGTMTETVIEKRGDRWVSTVTSLLADGTKRSNTDTMTISDDGTTHVHEGTSIGSKFSEYRGVWRRAEQSTGPDYEQLKAMQWLIGDWEADYVVTSPGLGLEGFSPGAKVHATSSFYWMENKNYIGLKFRDEVDGRVVRQGFEMVANRSDRR